MAILDDKEHIELYRELYTDANFSSESELEDEYDEDLIDRKTLFAGKKASSLF